MFKIFGRIDDELSEILDHYRESHQRWTDRTPLSRIPWAFDNFDNERPILSAFRRFYRSTLDNRMNYPEPFFSSAEASFYRLLEAQGLDWVVNEYDPPGKLRRHF
jgi:hypothetical protein